MKKHFERIVATLGLKKRTQGNGNFGGSGVVPVLPHSADNRAKKKRQAPGDACFPLIADFLFQASHAALISCFAAAASLKPFSSTFFTPFRQLFVNAEESLQTLLLDFRQIADGVDVIVGWVDFACRNGNVLSSFSPPSIILSTPIARSLSAFPAPSARGYKTPRSADRHPLPGIASANRS